MLSIYLVVTVFLCALYTVRYLAEHRKHPWKRKLAIVFAVISLILLATGAGWIQVVAFETPFALGKCIVYPQPGGRSLSVCNDRLKSSGD